MEFREFAQFQVGASFASILDHRPSLFNVLFVKSESQRHPFETDPELKMALVAGLRHLLRKGLSERIQKGCVRFGDFTPFPGGLKSDLVGGLPIQISATMKAGDSELELHEKLMRLVNRLGKSPIFPEVLRLVRIDDERRVILMQELTGFDTFLDRVYKLPTGRKILERLTEKSVRLVETIHRLPLEDPGLSAFPRTNDPYFNRIEGKLKMLTESDKSLNRIWESAGKIRDVKVPPLENLLPHLRAWLKRSMASAEASLVHGDPHLGNLMVRKHGKGYSVRSIDPNPTVGISDPIYDFGKLFHWTEEVGWAKIRPSCCSCQLHNSGSGEWRLQPRVSFSSKAAEERRIHVENVLWRETRKRFPPSGEEYGRVLVSIASAHLGLATTDAYSGADGIGVRRFVLAYALRALARWNRHYFEYGGRKSVA